MLDLATLLNMNRLRMRIKIEVVREKCMKIEIKR